MATLQASSSDIDICARALVMIGANPITSFTDGTTEATVASNTYEDTIRADLAMMRWRFASGQVQLSRLTAEPAARFDAAYQLPSDLLVLHTVTIADNHVSYDRYEDMVYCNATTEDKVIADYTYRPDESYWPPYFVIVAQYHMASVFAAAIARDAGIQKMYTELYGANMRIARNIDSQSQTSKKLVTNRFRNFRNSVGSTTFRTG